MTREIGILVGVTLLFVSLGLVPEADDESASSLPFSVARVHFERNATDGDVEVVFQVKGGDQGLTRLTVFSPDGRTVIDFIAPNASTLGMRQFRFESPEPGDIESLMSAYPEGVYTFAGETAGGDRLHGESTLNQKLPATASFLRPQAHEENVDSRNLEITWTTVRDLTAYIVYIEQDELDVNITAKFPRSAAPFTVPHGFLLPGKEYHLGIGTVTDGGNISFVETTFTTAEMK